MKLRTDDNTTSQTEPMMPSDPENLQQWLQALIEGARENWTYAILWQSSSDSLLGWGNGYYRGGEEKGNWMKEASRISTEEQARRKKVLRELNSLICAADGYDCEDDPEYVSDTEWFFLVSMTKSFPIGSGIPGQALLSSSPIWVAGAERLAGYPCERARQSQVFGIRTMVSISTDYGVVELGSTELVFATSSGLLQRFKQLKFGVDDGLDLISTSPSNSLFTYCFDDGLDLSSISPSNTIFTTEEIRKYLGTPSPPPTINQTHLAQQENPEEDSGVGNDEVDQTIGILGAEGTGEGAIVEGLSNSSGCLGNGKRNGKTAGGGESGNNVAAGVKIAIPLEEILQNQGLTLVEAAKNLKVSRSTLKRICRSYSINRWPPRKGHELINQSHPNENLIVVDQGRIPQSNSDTLLPSNQKSATIDKNSVTVKARYGGGESGNNVAAGVKIAIPLEENQEILQNQGMTLAEAAKNLINVSRSTLKRDCRGHGINGWPPHKKHELVNQSHPNKNSTAGDQERIPLLNSDTLLPCNQNSATIDKNSVTVKARYGKVTMKFQLSSPWGLTGIEQQVKKRLKLEAGTYYTNYKDEDNELILIACDEDLQDYISGSSLLGTSSIEVFLEPK